MTGAAVPIGASATAPRVIAWTRTCAALVVGFAAIGVWWPVLGAGTLWILPILALTAGVAGGAIELRDSRVRFAFPWLWIFWTPVALLLAGLPVWTVNPLQIGTTLREMAEALRAGISDPAPSADPWLLAAWLHTCGLFWFIAAGWAQRGARAGVAAAFFLFTAPFALPLAFGGAADAAWQGGVIIVAGLLWATRGNLRDGLPALAVVAIAGVIVAAAFAPRDRWSGLDRHGGQPFSKLDSTQTYGPPNDRKTGATMFDIRAQRPSLWRMEVLEEFTGSVWKVADYGQELPQPTARRTTSTVRIDGLGNGLAVGPGRIENVAPTGGTMALPRRAGSESVPLSPSPKQGQTYTVTSEEVPLTPELADVPIPQTTRGIRRLTSVFPDPDFPNPVVGNVPSELQTTPFGRAALLAQQLGGDSTQQLEVVERVQQYLTQSGQFKYTLDVQPPGPYPLLDFLLQTHQGYCQHFAGAAGLLLRMNGIPTRVVSGFATGLPSGDGQWRVRDSDAHAWIEVYFEGHGWVPFDVTPPAEAQVADGVGQAAPGPKNAPVDGRRIPVALLVGVIALIAAVLAVWLWRRRTPGDRESLGDVLASIVPAPAEPGMTFDDLRADLRVLGPAVTALADEAERDRFRAPPSIVEQRPRRRVWRALLSDVGVLRTVRIMVLGPGRRPIITIDASPKVATARPPSVAPPGT